MAEKRKKGSAVEFGDFDMDEATINRIKSERAESADRVARFNSTFVPTGSAFKDTSAFSGTSRDVKNMRQADLLLDRAADRGVAVRGQDIQLELGRGEIGVNTERNRINEKGIDVQRELGLGELEVNRDRNRINEKGIDKQFELGKGELNLNQDIFLQQAARYRKYGEPADLFALTERAAKTRVGAEQAGLELSDDILKATEKYLKPESKKIDPVATQPRSPLEIKNTVPFEGYVPYPQVLEAAPLTYYGSGIIPQIGGSAVEGVKLLGRTAARISAADPLSPSRRYKIKVNK